MTTNRYPDITWTDYLAMGGEYENPLHPWPTDEQTDKALTLPDDPMAEWFANPADDPADTVLDQLAERCALILPGHPADDALAYVIALHRHAVYGTDETFAALLAVQPYQDRRDAEDALYPGEIAQSAPAFGWLDPATANTPAPAKATHKRADGTVRGHENPTVIGDDADGIHRAMPAGELLARADLWAKAHGARLPDLIGTESSSWQEIVTFTTDRETVSGITYTVRPLRDASDIAVGDGRKRRPYKDRTAQYHPRPELEYLPWSHFLATGERVRKHYRTRFLVSRTRVEDESGEIGHVCVRAEWNGHRRTRTTATIARAVKPTGRKIETPTVVAPDDLARNLQAAYGDPALPSRYRITRPDETTVTVMVDRKNRRYVTSVKHADGTTARRNARTLDATLRAVANL